MLTERLMEVTEGKISEEEEEVALHNINEVKY